jgi:hypothetical protein
VVDVLDELRLIRRDDMGLQRCERDAVLIQHVHDREFSAECVAPLAGAHRAETVGIGVDEDRHPRVAQRGNGAVLVAEIRKRDDHAVDLPAVLVQELRKLAPFLRRFHGAVARGVRVHQQGPMAQSLERCAHLRAGRSDQRRGKEAAIPKEDGKGEFRRFHKQTPVSGKFAAHCVRKASHFFFSTRHPKTPPAMPPGRP